MITRRNLTLGATIASTAMMMPNLTSAKTKLHVPAEHSTHERTFMQWPNSRAVYKDALYLEDVQNTIANIANAIAEFEPVVMLADEALYVQARKKLSETVKLWNIPTEDLWARDAGPIFASQSDGSLAISHIQFNGWGEKQINTNDAQIAQRVAKRLGLPIFHSGLRGEGGGLDHDGKDTLIAHESSWVNDNRNPGLPKAEISRRLKDAYGAKRIVWTKGVSGEDITDYHIDSLARFTAPETILINLPQKPYSDDPFHQSALETHDALKRAGFEIDVIPEPNFRRVKSDEFVASYANYYACNGAVIAAEFGDKETDAEAVTALKRHYPGREIIALNVDALGELGGGIHCATQQMPKV